MQPGQFNPKGEDWIGREFAELRKEIRELRAANPYTPMGMRPMEGGVEFTGNMKVAGTLDLPAGIIGNDALANPIAGAVASGAASGFALPGAASPTAILITKTITVPAGFTQAHVLASADMTAVNTTASPDYAYARVRIADAAPTYLSGTYTMPGQYAFVGSNFTSTLTNLGASFAIKVEAGADTVAWAADDINTANLSVMVLFLR